MSAASPPRPAVSWQLLVALVAAGVCVCSALAFVFVDNPFTSEGGATAAASPSVSATAAAPAASPPAEADLTQAFKDFAEQDTVRPPEWVAFVTRVYQAEDGMMWAVTRWPAGYVDRGRNVQSMCGVLSSFVLRTSGGQFSGVTVRANDGSELVTRKAQTDSCAQ
jgi:hypothetical protein